MMPEASPSSVTQYDSSTHVRRPSLLRPPPEINQDRIRALHVPGRSHNQIADEMGVSVSLVRRELAKSRENTEPIPIPADSPEAELGDVASTAETQPGPLAHSDGTCPVLKPRANQAGIAFGNAPYSGDPAAIRPMHPAFSCVRASGDGKPWYFDQTPLDSKGSFAQLQGTGAETGNFAEGPEHETQCRNQAVTGHDQPRN